MDWTFALRIRGVTRRTLPMGRVGEYLKQFSSLVGESNEPIYAGIVGGSVVLRAAVPAQKVRDVQVRLRSARQPEDPTSRIVQTISGMLEDDQAAGVVEDRTGAVILEFRPARSKDLGVEHIVQDTAHLDGVVVGIEGIDDTAHVRVQVSKGAVCSLTVRDLALARQLAQHFRAASIRAYVHGTWKRTADADWIPHNLYLDRFEALDEENPSELLSRLAKLPGNDWSSVEDAEALLSELRGSD